ncbi:epimerase domain protein [Rhodococcus sp. MTM3W5.2]|nr:epimerase domain protein [Rhodococcus sp. MTM3W5.2]
MGGQGPAIQLGLAAKMSELMLGVAGAYPEGSSLLCEMSPFGVPAPAREDPVTGSTNAVLAQ